MSREIVVRPLTREAFAPFGDVLDTDWTDRFSINEGRCERFHSLARAEAIGSDASVIISIFQGTAYTLPLQLRLVERHPLGSQAFMPLDDQPFLVVVCPSADGLPGRPEAFLTARGQGVSYRRDTWHAVLTPIGDGQRFLVVDRDGKGCNLEEHVFDEPWLIIKPQDDATVSR